MSDAQTIFALATAPGKSGVAVLRISGRHATQALSALTALPCPAPRRADYVTLSHNGVVVDRGIAIYFKAPHSFTGEDVVELQVHGSLAVIGELLRALGTMDGLRPAEPGEFTRRAYLNGKMDLMEAEGLADLIDAETTRQKSQAMRQMEGKLSKYYNGLRESMIENLAHLEAYIDFPDEEIPESVLAQLSGNIIDLQNDMKKSLADGARGERLRDGINVVILGAPNAGKSSLLNVISGREAAIVSHKAGTTRDLIEIHMDIAGYPVVFVDTAGIRETTDDIEEEGVRRALDRAQKADIKLVLFDGASWPQRDAQSLQLLDENAISVITKSDLLTTKITSENHSISTKTGEGVGALLKEIERRIISRFSSESTPFITRNRHRALLSEAHRHLEKSLRDQPLELKCEELRLAALCVGKITGKIQVDDVLDVIFSSFCIGK